MKTFHLLAVAVLLVVATPLVAAAQQTAGTQVDIANVNLARYSEGGRVTMVVELRKLTSAMDPSQLVVTQNGTPVENVQVEPIQSSQVPVGVVLVIDTSGSMKGAPLDAAKAAAKAFVAQKRPEDFVALVSFSDTVIVQSTFTTSTSTLNQRIDDLQAKGSTAFFDGVTQAADLYQGSTSALRKNMIVLTDGADTASKGTLDDSLAAVKDQNIRVFGIALESPDFKPQDLQQLVDSSNGLYLSTPDPKQLTGLYGQIQRELNNTLVVRFSSSVTEPGPVEFGVSYGGVATATSSVDVPGYVTSTTQGPSTTTTFAQAAGSVVVSDLPFSPSSMVLFSTLAIGATTALFLYILLGGGREEDSAFMRRLQAYGRRAGQREEQRSLLDRIPLLRRFTQAAEEEVRRRGMLSGINAALEQGNIPLAAGEAITAAFGISGIVGLIATVFFGGWIAGLVAFGLMVLLVFGVINWAGSREKKRFENQLPDTLTLVSTSLRAGYSLLQAVEAVAAEAPNPTAREFGRALAEARLGRPVTEALDGIVQRVRSEDFRWAVMAIEIQREVGGNLAEVLQTVADTMLARNRLRGEIKALTAEGRISAYVLGALPFVMALFIWTTNRDYLQPLLTNTFGQISIAVGLLLMGAGVLWLRKIVNIEV